MMTRRRRWEVFLLAAAFASKIYGRGLRQTVTRLTIRPRDGCFEGCQELTHLPAFILTGHTFVPASRLWIDNGVPRLTRTV